MVALGASLGKLFLVVFLFLNSGAVLTRGFVGVSN